MTFNTLETELLKLLRDEKELRDDDMRLYMKYVMSHIGDSPILCTKIFLSREFRLSCNLAPYDSIGRIRRKIQREHPDLKPTDEEVEKRKELESNYRKHFREKL